MGGVQSLTRCSCTGRTGRLRTRPTASGPRRLRCCSLRLRRAFAFTERFCPRPRRPPTPTSPGSRILDPATVAARTDISGASAQVSPVGPWRDTDAEVGVEGVGARGVAPRATTASAATAPAMSNGCSTSHVWTHRGGPPVALPVSDAVRALAASGTPGRKSSPRSSWAGAATHRPPGPGRRRRVHGPRPLPGTRTGGGQPAGERHQVRPCSWWSRRRRARRGARPQRHDHRPRPGTGHRRRRRGAGVRPVLPGR